MKNMVLRKWILAVLVAALPGCATAPADYAGADAPRTGRITPLSAKRPVIGLVLGAGGSRGFAHIGVIKVLEAAGIEPDLLVGVSSGAIVASLYAGGYRSEALEKLALEVEDGDLLDFTLFGPGTIEGGRLQGFINRALGNRLIENLDKPFAAIAAERGTSRMTVFNRGNTGMAVRASASVPQLFWPVIIRGAEYVDGGVASRVPAPVARDMGADIVIAVDVSWRESAEAALADVVIRPPVIRSRITDFQHKLENMAAGETAARAALPLIRERIAAADLRKRQSEKPVATGRLPAPARTESVAAGAR